MHRLRSDSVEETCGPPWEEREFRLLFLENYDAVYRLVFRITGERAEAEDLTQETFLRCYRQAPPREEIRNVRAWLCRIAINLAMNAARADRRRREGTARAGRLEAASAAGSPDPAAELARGRVIERVRRILANLPERQAQLLHLRQVGLSYRELASALGLAPASMGTLLARAEAEFARAWSAEEDITNPVSRRGAGGPAESPAPGRNGHGVSD